MANSPRYSREIPHRFRLEAQQFDSGFVSLPNRYVCPDTCSKSFKNINLSGIGTILSFTTIHIASDQFARQAPFTVAVIETEEGARLTVQVVDCKPEDVKIGSKVKLVFRKIMEESKSGIINYGYKALLLDE